MPRLSTLQTGSYKLQKTGINRGCNFSPSSTANSAPTVGVAALLQDEDPGPHSAGDVRNQPRRAHERPLVEGDPPRADPGVSELLPGRKGSRRPPGALCSQPPICADSQQEGGSLKGDTVGSGAELPTKPKFTFASRSPLPPPPEKAFRSGCY